MPKFIFGTHETWSVDAPSLKRAILMFRAGVLYPHNFAENPVWGDLRYEGRGVALSSTGVVQVRCADEVVARIPPDDPETDELGFGRLLVGGEAEGAEGTTALVPASMAPAQTATRSVLAQRGLDLMREQAELERKLNEVRGMVGQIRAELALRMEQVWIIELFLGVREEVTVLRQGDPAPVGTKISVFQATLCMDEEIAVADMYAGTSNTFTARRLADFDNWLLDPRNLDAVLPAQKGIRAFRVRRHEKARHSSDIGQAIANIVEAGADRRTYLLVRNGEQLYRLWIDVVLWPRLLLAPGDITASEAADWRRGPLREREVESNIKHNAAGMVAINGILQRSQLLHPLPRPNLNVFDNADVSAHFDLVLDDEGHNRLGDGRLHEHLTWDGYFKWLKAQVAVGVRVVYLGPRHSTKPQEFSYSLANRLGRYEARNWEPFQWPSPDEPWTVVHMAERPGHGYAGEFMYLPETHCGSAQRHGSAQRRVRFQFYREEVLPIDFVSWRVLEHLIGSRPMRGESWGWHNGSGLFETAIVYLRIAKAEMGRERPFVDLVLTQAGVSLDDDTARARVERLLRWWKLKVKEHRTLGTDEPKALRMVLDAFQREDDHDNDPETLLLRGGIHG